MDEFSAAEIEYLIYCVHREKGSTYKCESMLSKPEQIQLTMKLMNQYTKRKK